MSTRHEATPSDTIAIIGGGAAGIAAAFELTRRGHAVVSYEAAARLGGNCTSVTTRGTDGRAVTVDLGVSDFNRATFVQFDAFLRALGIEARPITEDATVVHVDGTTACTTRGGRFVAAAGPRASARLEAEIAHFVRSAPAVLQDDRPETLGAYLARHGYSEAFRALYARPRAGGCIVMPAGDPDDHDARALVRFWQLHGLVGAAPRRRMHVIGGMASYCAAMSRWLAARGGRVRLGARVERITRGAGGVIVEASGPAGPIRDRHAHVIVAVDPSAVAALVDADDDERRAFASIRCARVEVVLHRDARVMPRERACWSAYTFYAAPRGARRAGPTITFYPHRLAGVSGAEGLFVTLGSPIDLRDERVVERRTMVHPVADPAASRPELFAPIQGRGGLWYAGAWLEAPWLHEQAFRSGTRVAEAVAARAIRHERAA